MREIFVAFLLICILCQTTATESCNVTIEMSSTNPVKVGENLNISCSVLKACKNEMIQWIWYYNNSAMEEIRVDMDGSGSSTSYEFSPVKESDNGTYECVANISGSLYMNNILLTVKDTNVVKVEVQSQELKYSSNGSISCIITLNTDIGPDTSVLTVEWYHNNNSIVNNTLNYTVLSLTNISAKEFNSTLKISQVEASHSGNYTCVARIGEENQKKSSKDICVNYEQLTIPSSSYTGLTLGDNVNILCTSQELKESEATITWIDPNNHTLHNPLMLSPVSVSHNNTRYTCNVRIHDNPSSCENNTQDIIITIKDTYVTEVIIIPAVGTVPNNLTVGQTANVNCNAVLNTNIDDNMSSVHKEWYHNEMITDHETIQRSGLQLRLSKVRASFAGYYKCVAWINDNTLTNESNSILLCVTLPTPLVTIDSKNLQDYNTSTSLDLTCSASISSSESTYVDVFTSAVFEWRYIRGGSEFPEILPTSKNDLKMYTSTLSLHNFNLSSAGEYTCDVYLYSNISFVKNSTHESNKTTIKIKVPTPNIILNTTGALYNVGTLMIVSCKIILSRANIDENTMANFTLYKKDVLRETRMTPVVTEGENLTYCADFHFSNIKLSVSGIYKCEGFVDDDINSSFIIPNDVVEDYTTVNVKIPTPEINLNTSDVYYIAGSSLVLSCQMTLLSGNIDIETVAVFELKSNNDNVALIREMDVPNYMNDNKFVYTAFFHFDIVKLSDAGEYTCTGSIDDAMKSSFIIQSNKTIDSGNIYVKIPTPQIALNTSDVNYVTGSSLVLRCELTLLSEIIDIATIANFRLKNDNDVTVLTNEITVPDYMSKTGVIYSSFFQFNNLKLSDAGNYTCTGSIDVVNSSFIMQSNKTVDSGSVFIKIPMPEINLNTSDVYYIAGSSLVLSCQLLLMSDNIDNDTVAIFELKSNINDVLISALEVINEANLIYTAYFHFDDLKLSAAEEYTCTGIIDDALNSSFIIQSNKAVDSGSIFIKIPTPQIALFTGDGDYVAGNLLVLRCQLMILSGNIDISTIASLQLKSDNDDAVLSNESTSPDSMDKQKLIYTSIFQFNNIKLSDAGNYTCTGVIDAVKSSFVEQSNKIVDSGSISITIPTPLVTIDSQNLQVYNTSNSLDLTCIASISSSESPYVDVFTSAVFEWIYIRGGSEFPEILPTSNNDLKIYTSSLSLHNINLSSAGEYTCDVYLYSNFSFVKNSTHESNETAVRIKVPTPDIILNTTGSLYNVGTQLNISCEITLLRRENIDVITMATIKLYNKDVLRETRMIPVITKGENLTYRADFHFSNINSSDSGIYKCEGFVDDDISSSFIIPSDVVEDYITINVKIPTPEINLNTSDVYYIAGTSLVLRCQLLSGNIDDDTVAMFQLKSNIDDRVLFNNRSMPEVISTMKVNYRAFFNFNILKLSDAGEYTCTGYINNDVNLPYIIQSNETIDSGIVFVKMPTPEIMNLNTSDVYYIAGNSLVLSCQLIVLSENIDIDTVAVFELKNNIHDVVLTSNMSVPEIINETKFSYTAFFNFPALNLSTAGEYTCTGIIDDAINSSFIIQSNETVDSGSVFIKVPTPQIVLNTSGVYYIAGSSLVLSCQLMLLSENIDNDTVAVFELKSTYVVLTNESSVSEMINESKVLYYAFFHFDDLKLSAAGEYTCTGIIDDAMNSSFIIQSNKTIDSGSILIKIPMPQIITNITNETYTTGSELTLSCVITLMNQNIDINTEAYITWTNNTSVIKKTMVPVVEGNITYTSLLSFDGIKLSDASNYTCSGYIDNGENSFIMHSDEAIRSGNISVIIPTPYITLNVSDEYYQVGESLLLNCTSNLNMEFIDVKTITTFIWKHHSTILKEESVDSTLVTTSNLEVGMLDISDSGMYSCEVIISSLSNHIIPSDTIGTTVNITVIETELKFEMNVIIISVVVGALIVLILVVVSIIICLKCCKKQMKTTKKYEVNEFAISVKPKENDEDSLELKITNEVPLYQNFTFSQNTSQHLIAIQDFPVFVKNSLASLQSNEYEDINTLSPLKLHDISDKYPEKNRFQNILPFDETIVTLKSQGNDESQYINASFIDGYERSRAYIATQGPLPHTAVDFWRMIWEFKLPTIVMLTQEVEKGITKCARYWPEQVDSIQEFGQGLMVKLLKQEFYHGYSCKTFSLQNTNEKDSSPFQVTHYHFTEWPDHGVPDDKICMLTLISRIRQTHPPDGPPLVVHCSAGVGRTGTFIVLDTMLQRMKHHDTLNIYDCLMHIRQQRIKLVQTEAQYIYIHESLAEYIQCGDTSFPINGIHQVIKELCEKTGEKSKLTKQFDLLQEVSPPSFASYNDAKENPQSNRYTYNLPFDHSRVVLRTVDIEENYINASRIDGYKKTCCFIASQSPLENTVGHFWRMLLEQQSSTVVMLCKLLENHQIQCHTYWPQSLKEKNIYGNITVTLTTETQERDYIVRCFEAKMEAPFRSLSVTQFHFLDWPEDDKPRDNFSLLKMLNDVVKNQSNTGNKPITVMCNDGIGRTGAFMTIYSQMEKAKPEGVVDLFQFVSRARKQRSGLVRSKEQYLFCHEVLADYAEEMSKYENFKDVI